MSCRSQTLKVKIAIVLIKQDIRLKKRRDGIGAPNLTNISKLWMKVMGKISIRSVTF